MAAFAAQQGAWPTSTNALMAWGRCYRISLSLGPARELPAARKQARKLLKDQGLKAPQNSRALTAGQFARDLPAPAGPAAASREVGKEACIDAVVRFLDDLPAGVKPTVARYRDWCSTRADAPWPRVFQQHGGWVAVLEKARKSR